MPSQDTYRVEHVATVPAGYKVRTVTRGGHELRIAFPKGARKTGSGKLVEILHPRTENPCRLPNPAELLVLGNPMELIVAGNPARKRRARKGNPDGAEQASELYQDFHGAPSKHIDEYSEPSPIGVTLTELGDLIEIRVKCGAGWKLRSLDFKGCGIKLASNPAGTQLYFVGGEQRVRSFAAFGADKSKELVDLGEATYIAYRAKKAQVNGIASDYEHYLGEETKVYPRLMYNRSITRLFFVGGQYHIEGVGIVN